MPASQILAGGRLSRAAAFSSVVQLSEWSVLNNSNSIQIPDFTRGAWKTNDPNMDINLENGGVTTNILA